MRAGQQQPCVTLREDGHGGDAKMGMELRTGQLQHCVALLGKVVGGRASTRILDTHVHTAA